MSKEFSVDEIIRSYCNDQDILVSEAYPDGGIDPLFPRLKRAAMNQESNGDAVFSRYAIWANTVRDNLISALEHSSQNNHSESNRLIRRSVNSLSAFAEIQAIFDPMNIGSPTDSPTILREKL